jgi:hypothetical protein
MPNGSTPLDFALTYIARGWNPVQVPHRAKKPSGDAWQSRIIDVGNAAAFFDSKPQNIGVQMGATSHGLCDVDLDCPEAVAIAPYLLPATKAIFGRKSNPASHWLFYSDLATTADRAIVQFKAINKTMLLELRVGGGEKGAQTIFPGSEHPSGEAIKWAEAGEPATVEGKRLLRRVSLIAAACLITRAWPDAGGRHDAALTVGGFFRRAGLKQVHVGLVAEAIARAAGDPEWRDRVQAAKDHAEHHEKTGKGRGLPSLAELVGEKAAERIARWLDYDEVAQPQPPPASAPAATANLAPWTIEQTLAVFQRWLLLKDMTPVLAMLGTVAANLLPGDPVWLGIVAPPSSSKTELLNSLSMLPRVHPAATLSMAGLLSGTPMRQRRRGTVGGLLPRIGDFGFLVLKDFGSVLSMRPDNKAELLAALREIYDGAWTRHLGADGGQTLSWQGKIGLLFGVTGVIDAHHGVIGAMGDRFLLSRMSPVIGHQFRRALAHVGAANGRMRQELAEAVAHLFAGRRPEPRPLTEREIAYINAIIVRVVYLRGSIERDRQSRDIEAILGAEGPSRIGLALERVLSGLDTLGVDRLTACRVIRAVAFHSVPPTRLRAYEFLRSLGWAAAETPAVAHKLGLPTSTAKRALEDLAAYGLAVRTSQGQGKADLWQFAPPPPD